VVVEEIGGGRLAFQVRSWRYLWRRAADFDVILSQELLRGSLNATVISQLRGVPVVTYMGIAPVEYFRCRRERRQVGWLKGLAADGLEPSLTTSNVTGVTPRLRPGLRRASQRS